MAKCGPYNYSGITQTKIDKVLEALKKNGASVSGNNPWDVDTHKYGVKLRGSWNASAQVLSIEVTGKDFFVSCSRIKDELDKLLSHLATLSDTELLADDARQAAAAVKCGPWTYGNIDQARIDLILSALKKNGATVSGSNPWDVDTHKYGVKLRGAWNANSRDLVVTVTGKDFFVSCSRIKDELDKLIPHIASLPSDEVAAAQAEAAVEAAVEAAPAR